MPVSVPAKKEASHIEMLASSLTAAAQSPDSISSRGSSRQQLKRGWVQLLWSSMALAVPGSILSGSLRHAGHPSRGVTARTRATRTRRARGSAAWRRTHGHPDMRYHGFCEFIMDPTTVFYCPDRCLLSTWLTAQGHCAAPAGTARPCRVSPRTINMLWFTMSIRVTRGHRDRH